MTGTIIRIISNLYTVSLNGKIYETRARGKFRKDNIKPLVGDHCIIDEKEKYILEILPRKNELLRPKVANVDAALIVTSVKDPDLSLNLLDKLISVVSLNNITPVICFTKLDLANSSQLEDIKQIRAYYESLGYLVFDNQNLDELKNFIKGKTIVLAGQSGAGKSSLLNKLNPALNLQTNAISLALGRGKHTTRHTELFELNEGFVVDTPGFSALDLSLYTKEEVRDSFKEFQEYNCKFKDCMHLKEIGCDVKRKVENKEIMLSRYENYQSFLKEVLKCK